MQKYFLTEARKHIRALHHKKRRKKIITALSVMVVLCTAYALMLPAVTMENQNDSENQAADGTETTVYSCQLTEHTHSPACYQPQNETYESESPPESVESDKSDSPIRGDLICNLHEHTDSCQQIITTLICGFPEQQEQSKQPENSEEPENPEATEQHQHTDTCWQTTTELTCGVTDEHRHTDDCYEWLTPLCGMAEHTHNDSCKVPAATNKSTENKSTENNATENESASNIENREFTADELTLIDNVIALIAALPDDIPEDIPDDNAENGETDRTDGTNETDGTDKNNSDIRNSVTAAYSSYSELAPELQAMVTNSQKLLALVRLYTDTSLSQPATDEQPQPTETPTATPIPPLKLTPELPPDADPSVAHYFQALRADNPKELYIGANIAYDILDSDGNKIDRDFTDENGIFTLLPGYTAVFNDIPSEPDAYIIQELTNTPVPTNTLSINSVQIPVSLTLQNTVTNDDKTFQYTVSLEQVTDQTGATLSTPSFTRNLTLTIDSGKSEATGNFTLDYSSIDANIDADTEFPAVCYYKITMVPPTTNGGITSAVLDKTVYVAEVTFTKATESDVNTVTAALGSKYKISSDTGTELTPADNITFTNKLLRYELPDTGGTGTLPFALPGLICLATALVLLCRRKSAN